MAQWIPKIGDRVRVSDYGRACGIYRQVDRLRVGTVVTVLKDRYGKDLYPVTVRWDGTRYAGAIAVSFIEPVERFLPPPVLNIPCGSLYG